MDTLFVRDSDFMLDLAREFAREMDGVMSHYGELVRANDAANAENVVLRHARSEAVKVASDVVDVMRHLSIHWPKRWASFLKMVKKQTVRKIVRGVKKGDRGVVKGDIEWCAWYIRKQIGEARLEALLTLRSELA
jgi:hypothetical protein